MKKIIPVIAVLLLFSLAACTQNSTTEAVNGLYTNEDGNVFCIIYDGTVTISVKTGANAVTASSITTYVFEFTLDNGSYKGENGVNTVSFRLNDDKLNLELNGKTYRLSLDKSVSINNETAELDKPGNIDFNLSQIFWYWNTEEFNNPYECGILNACVEVTSEENGLIASDYINYIPEPACMFSYDLRNMELAPGDYILSVRYIGGWYVKNGAVYHSANSEAVVFFMTVTEENEYIIVG